MSAVPAGGGPDVAPAALTGADPFTLERSC